MIAGIAPRPVVYVIDDEEKVRKSLKFLLESVQLRVSTHASAHEFLGVYSDQEPGCLVLDVRMPGMGGLELHEQLLRQGFPIPTIFLTAYGSIPSCVRAMRNGAVDYLEKPFNDQTLIDQVQASIARDAERHERKRRIAETLEKFRALTERERHVLPQVVEGLTSEEIAVQLGIKRKTIEAHRAAIMTKTKSKNVPQLIAQYNLVRDVFRL